MAKAHYEGTPLVWIDAVINALHQNRGVDMGSYDSDLECKGRWRFVWASAKRMTEFKDSFQLDWAFLNSWGFTNSEGQAVRRAAPSLSFACR